MSQQTKSVEVEFEYFIAKRIIAKRGKDTISLPIIKIAIVAIALGIVMMLIAISTGLGLQQRIREKLSVFNGDIQIRNYDSNRSEVSIVPLSIDQEFYPEFTQIPQIKKIQAVATKAGIIRTESTFEGVIVKGVGKDYDWKPMKDFLQQGRLPKFSSQEISDEMVISSYISKRMGLGLGDKCPMLFLKDEHTALPAQRNFTIVGIYDSGFQDFDASFVFADLRQIQHINGWKPDEVGSFELFVDDFSNLKKITSQVYLQTPSHLDVQDITEKYSFIFEWFKMFDFNIFLIIAIMVFVGGVNMITALLVLIFERTPMIGQLKALGAGNRRIQKIFLYHAAYLVVLGLFWGNVCGVGILIAQKISGFIKLNPQVYYVSEVPIYLSWEVLLWLNAGVFVLCMLMLLLPSYWVSRITPVRAIKFD